MPDLDLFGEAPTPVARQSNAGRPRVPLRTMIALLYLKHAFIHGWPRWVAGAICRRNEADGTGERLHPHDGCGSFVFRRKWRIHVKFHTSSQLASMLDQAHVNGFDAFWMLSDVSGQEFQDLPQDRIILSGIGTGQHDLTGALLPTGTQSREVCTQVGNTCFS